MKKISEGAEATIYAEYLFGNEIVIKSRKPKEYRIKELDNRIRRQRTKKEAKLMKKASDCGINVPKIIATSQTTIIMDKINGKLLKDIKISSPQAIQIGKILAELHNSEITHGDFTPANIIASGNKLYLIDFGLSEATSSSEEKALDILLMKRQLSSELYSEFIESYLKHAKSSKEIITRLAEIEERGRYQSRTLD